jgi:lysozyme family protein
VKFVTDDEVAAIYKLLYWDKIAGDALPIGIDYCVFDAAVNSGPLRGAKWLQAGINKCAKRSRCLVDCVIGPASIVAADDYNPHELIDAIIDTRVSFLKNLSIFADFGKGWMNRVLGYLPGGATVRRTDGVDDVAKQMANSLPSVGKPPLPDTQIKTEGLPLWVVAIIVAILAFLGVTQYG